MNTTHRVHRIEDSIAPLPPLRKAKGMDRMGSRGGLSPRPYRNSNNWHGGNAHACEPYSSRAIRVEVAVTRKWIGGF
jgi:hypothetical protein